MSVTSTLKNLLTCSDDELTAMQLIPHSKYRFSIMETINDKISEDPSTLDIKYFCCPKKALTHGLSLNQYSTFYSIKRVNENIPTWEICIYERGKKNIHRKYIVIEEIESNNFVRMSEGNESI